MQHSVVPCSTSAKQRPVRSTNHKIGLPESSPALASDIYCSLSPVLVAKQPTVKIWVKLGRFDK
jgi:hypothetical protein